MTTLKTLALMLGFLIIAGIIVILFHLLTRPVPVGQGIYIGPRPAGSAVTLTVRGEERER